VDAAPESILPAADLSATVEQGLDVHEALVLERMNKLLPKHEGALPTDVRTLRMVWEEPDYPGDQHVQAALSRLILRGRLKACSVAGTPHVSAPGETRNSLPPASLPPAARYSNAPPSQLETNQDAELFELQVALDVEYERALLYRVLVVLEILGFLLLSREFMMKLLELN
jgi:hypothetical protein